MPWKWKELGVWNWTNEYQRKRRKSPDVESISKLLRLSACSKECTFSLKDYSEQ